MIFHTSVYNRVNKEDFFKNYEQRCLDQTLSPQ